ncbi:MAG TPA: hypothetical protein VEB64_09415 [Azospirillaceae bacterium]|nr:hypothetical protein [Azospirillaceae bacterium]
MGIFCIGAMYGGTDDQTDTFTKNGVGYLGWTESEAPYAHQMFRRITIGDILCIKSYPPTQGTIIKAVGIVTSILPSTDKRFGEVGVEVNWRWTGFLPLRKKDDKADFMRRGSIYEELNPEVQHLLVNLLLTPNKP